MTTRLALEQLEGTEARDLGASEWHRIDQREIGRASCRERVFGYV